ncbi:hypothetical protein BL107_11611 [Synechococcus sp. BL107]|nr:hypothetical protein BL107_11611 [Synechococcus sp. BL107]
MLKMIGALLTQTAAMNPPIAHFDPTLQAAP